MTDFKLVERCLTLFGKKNAGPSYSKLLKLRLVV